MLSDTEMSGSDPSRDEATAAGHPKGDTNRYPRDVEHGTDPDRIL